MSKHTKISVEVETKELVEKIAVAESRSPGGQIKHWAKKDARRLKLRIGQKIKIPRASTFPENTDITVNKPPKGWVGDDKNGS